ncbi:MAG: GNAT family N-acetyltransferase [Alphaproteobacteria bacterium]|nr:GNAT family N-acetyltransferase [Alphaproteobacteria bacterium]
MKSKPLTRPADQLAVAYRDEITMDDWPGVRTVAEETGVFTEREVEIVRELMVDTIERPTWNNYRFWVAQADRVIAGFTCVSPIHTTPDRYEIYWIAVHPEFHGHGIASRLVDLAIARVRKQGGRKLYVETSTRSIYEPARKFYLAAGFVLEGTLPDYYADDDGKAIFARRL